MKLQNPTRRRLLGAAGLGAMASLLGAGPASSYNLSGYAPYGPYGVYGPPFSNKSYTFGQSGTWAVIVDRAGGLLFKILGPVAGTSPAITSWTASVLQSTDGGATWSTLMSGSTPFNFAVPVTTPALYRVDCTMSPGSVTAGGVAFTAEAADIYDQIAAVHGEANPLPDSALAGTLSLYKVCAGNTFAKLTAPAAARRIKGPYYQGYQNQGAYLWRDIRAEYVDVVAVVDANGNPVPQAASQTDASTIYKAGTRVTYRDPTGGLWNGDFACTAFPLGLYGYVTLTEAIQSSYVDRSTAANGSYNLPQPNPAAIAAALGA